MVDPALTVADLELAKSSDTFQSSDPHIGSGKETLASSSCHSILKKPKLNEPKKVIFSDPENYSVHEISFTKPQVSSSTSAESKETPESKHTLSKELPMIESVGTESLKTLSLLDSEGLLKSGNPQVKSALDLRWKANSITTKHLPSKHYGQSACEIFRQRLNNHYMKSIQRNMNSQLFDMKKPEPNIHMVEIPKQVLLVRSYNNNSIN